MDDAEFRSLYRLRGYCRPHLQNTDLNESGSGAYVNGYSNTGGVIAWTPASTAITSNHPIDGIRVADWRDDFNIPYSAEKGETYAYTSNSESDDSVYNSMAECLAADHFSDDCEHYQAGNYYNWTALIASNDSSSLGPERGATASNSVCPAGWRIPQMASDESETVNEFQNLFYNAGVITGIDSIDYTENGFNKVRSHPLYYTRIGYITNARLANFGQYGYYSSTVVIAPTTSITLFYDERFLDPNDGGYRWSGFPARCLVR